MRVDGDFVRAQLGRSANMKIRYDSRIKPAYDLKVGDRVWYLYPRRYTKQSPKFQQQAAVVINRLLLDLVFAMNCRYANISKKKPLAWLAIIDRGPKGITAILKKFVCTS